MKIDVLSDLHLDFWLPGDNFLSGPKADRVYNKFWNEVLDGPLRDKDSNELIIIAGDIGHYNHQLLTFFKFLKTKYKNVIWTHGNHDLYLIDHHQRKKYGANSESRLQEAIFFSEEAGAIYLDGDTVEINGIVFGGGSGWYDGSYCAEVDPRYFEPREVDSLWKGFMNDYDLINLPTHNWLEDGFGPYEKVQNKKLARVAQLADVIVSHISPTSKTIAPKYRNFASSGFYTFDYRQLRNGFITDKTWIFGHTHEVIEYNDIHGNWFICNPLGYKGEKSNPKGILTIQYEKSVT